jgi:hypothetical protein
MGRLRRVRCLEVRTVFIEFLCDLVLLMTFLTLSLWAIFLVAAK